MRIVRSRRAGYLLVLVAVCVSMLTISFLRLAARSADIEDTAQHEVAHNVAIYAAESGLLAAELELRRPNFQRPPAGAWINGELPISQARYRVEVLPINGDEKALRLRATGQTPGERGEKVSATLDSEYALNAKKIWVARSRSWL